MEAVILSASSSLAVSNAAAARVFDDVCGLGSCRISEKQSSLYCQKLTHHLRNQHAAAACLSGSFRTTRQCGRNNISPEEMASVSSPTNTIMRNIAPNLVSSKPRGAVVASTSGATSAVASTESKLSTSPQLVTIMVNDVSGKMGSAVATAALEAGVRVIPFAFTGPGLGGRQVTVGDVDVEIIGAEDRDTVMDKVLETYPDVIVVDYTLPMAVNSNAEFYTSRGVPFVMGTTGGDRDKLVETVNKAGTYAVIAPNMGKQIVAFQAAMEIMATNFPGAFSGYTLKVAESHQKTKLDTSGTAKAIVGSFQQLGLDFDVSQIELVRDPEEQKQRMGVPEEYLNGHAFHTYRIESKDKAVAFEFQHNVCGRSVYAEGTVDAVLFLAKKIREGAEQKLYNMVEILREGNMR